MLLPAGPFEADVTAWLYETAALAGHTPTGAPTGTAIAPALELYRWEPRAGTRYQFRQSRPVEGRLPR